VTALLVQGAHVLGPALLRTSGEASVLILLVLAMRAVLGRRLAPRWRHALWLLVVLRLALPVVPSSPTSLFNLAPVWSPPAGPGAAGTWRSTTGQVQRPDPGRSGVGSAPAPGVLESLLLAGWLAGVVLLLVRIVRRARRLAAQLRRQPPVTRPDVLALLEDCTRELRVRVPLQVVEVAQLSSPAVMGVRRPRLLLPAGLLALLDRDALRMLFLHELAHVKRKDVLTNGLASLVHVLHWFNPLVAVAIARLRADRELATDSLVLCHEKDGSRLYGTTLIRLLDFATRVDPLPESAVGVLEDQAELKNRVAMIAAHRPDDDRQRAVAVVLLVTLALTTLTGGRVTANAAHMPSIPLGIALDIKPAPDARNQLVAQARLTDLTTRRLFSSPWVRFSRGGTGYLKQRIQGLAEWAELEITVAVTPDGKTATYTATTRVGLSERDSLPQSQTVTVQLRP
jgi:bla regulator protein BlaR1